MPFISIHQNYQQKNTQHTPNVYANLRYLPAFPIHILPRSYSTRSYRGHHLSFPLYIESSKASPRFPHTQFVKYIACNLFRPYTQSCACRFFSSSFCFVQKHLILNAQLCPTEKSYIFIVTLYSWLVLCIFIAKKLSIVSLNPLTSSTLLICHTGRTCC